MSQTDNQILLQEPSLFLNNSGNPEIDLPQEQIQSDMAGIQNLLTNFTESAKETNEKISQFTELIQRNHETNSVQDNTPSFYAYKNLLLNQYLITLKFYELFRLNGISMTSGTGLQLYQKLFYLKTILIKLAPIDKKLEYQRDRLLSRASKLKNIRKIKPQQDNEQKEVDELLDNEISEQDEEIEEQPEEDELIYRPNVQQLLKSSKLNANNKKSQQKQEKYVAPKLSSVLPEDQKRKQKLEKQKQRRKAMLLRKFRGDIQQDDNAEEVGIQSNMYSSYKKKYEEKQQFELDNFVRLPETRKQKQEKKRIMKNQFKGNQLNDQFKETQLIRQLVQDEMKKKDVHGGLAEGPMPKKKRKIQ